MLLLLIKYSLSQVDSPILEEPNTVESDFKILNSADVVEHYSQPEASSFKSEIEASVVKEGNMSVPLKQEPSNTEIVTTPSVQPNQITSNRNLADFGQPLQITVPISPPTGGLSRYISLLSINFLYSTILLFKNNNANVFLIVSIHYFSVIW